MTRDEFEKRVVAVAQSWVGVPYRDNGRTRKGGVDCLGLVHVVFRDTGFPECPDGDGRVYDPQWYKHMPDRYLDGLLGSCEHVTESEWRPGDILMFDTIGVGVHHAGIFTGSKFFIHAIKRETMSRVAGAPLNKFWRKCLRGGVRPRFVPQVSG